jgi:hypothetical protein
MLRTLKPGGKLVIIDSDDAIWGLSEPAIPELSAVLQVYGQAQAMQGGNRLVGRFLVRLLQQAGCINPDLEVLVSHSDLIGLDALLPHLDPDRLMPLVSCGALPADALDAYRASHRTFTGADSPQLIMLLLMACGQKPGTPTTERIGALGSTALP